MDREKCEKCPKKDDCIFYDLMNYIDETKDDYEIEPIIIPHLDTEHSLIDSNYLKQLLEKNPTDSETKEQKPLDVLGDFVNLLAKKGPPNKMNVFNSPMISLKENPNHMPLKGRKFPPSDRRIEIAVQFWKEILIDDDDKELVEASIEALQYILPDVNIIEDIRENHLGTLNGVFEKCRKMKIKGFKVNKKV